MTRYYDDLKVGDTYDVGSYTLPKSEIIEFALQFDPQPFHTDEEAAKNSVFGELVASGLHTLCLSVRLFITEFVNKNEGVANMGGLGMDGIQWNHPVKPNDTLRLRIHVADKSPSESRSDRGYVDFDRTVFNDSDEAVLEFTSYNIIQQRE